MAAVPSANGNTANLHASETLSTSDLPRASASLTQLSEQLRGLGATGAASRITRATGLLAVDDSQHVSFDDLVRIIDPELVIDERAEACGRLRRKKDSKDERNFLSRLWGLRKSVRHAQWLRNTAALIPLIVTWSALGWAAWKYELDLHTVKGDNGKPFLLLWQQGFADHVIPFGWVAAIDAVLLFVIVALTWWVHRAEMSAEDFETSVWAAVGELEEAMDQGASRVPVSAEDAIRKFGEIVNGAFHRTEELAKRSGQILSDASAQFAKSQARTQELIQALQAGDQALAQQHQALIQGMQTASRTLIEELQKGNQAVIQGMQTDGRTLIGGLKEGNEKFLTEFQGKTKDIISLFSTEVLGALSDVRKQNEAFIKDTREANARVLNDLVQRQITPLLTDMGGLLDQFRTQQESYTATVAGLTGSVSAIQQSAAGLADDSREFAGSTRSIAGSLQEMTSSQERFADQVRGSAQSMTTAATSMTEVKDTLKAVLVDSAQEMTGNLKHASDNLAQTQSRLAETQAGLVDTTAALRDAAANLRKAARPAPPAAPDPPVIPEAISQLPALIAGLTAAINGLALTSTGRPGTDRPSTGRRRWWQWRRRPDGPGGE